MAQIKRQALTLDPSERIRLVQDIWDSVVKESGAVRIPKSHKTLLNRRIEEHEANPASAISFAQLKAQIRRHRSRKQKAG